MKPGDTTIWSGVGLALAVVVGGSVWGSTGWAQQSEDRGRILHRYFDVEQWRPAPQVQRQSGQQGSTRSVPGDGDVAPQVRRPQGVAGEAPGLWLSPGEDEWILSSDGPIGPDDIDAPHGGLDGRGAPTELDDATDEVDHLDYQANFDPSVVPMKRGVAQNRAGGGDGGTPVTSLEPGRLRSVPVGGGPREDDDSFWGTFLVRMEPDREMMIPSVGPDQRVLEVMTEPPIGLEIRRDEADNFYVSGPEKGLVRINMRVAVDRQYFDGALDAAVGWDAFEPGTGLDDQYLMDEAQEVLEMIGVSRGEQTPVQALGRLVEYHREFEMREAPDIEGIDRYVELSRLQLGVCRHRALLFTISAMALGIETRYVYNEAHAFVEVYWPGQGWRRIDLGGAAETFDYQARGGDSVHDGIWDDELPRPESYEEEMSAMGAVDADRGASNVEGGDASAEDSGDDPMDRLRELGAEVDDDEMTQREGGETRSTVQLLEADGEVYRGGDVTIRGRVEPPQRALSVRVVLVPVRAQGTAGGIPVGEATSGPEGYFEARGTIPDDISLGRWKLSGEVLEE